MTCRRLLVMGLDDGPDVVSDVVIDIIGILEAPMEVDGPILVWRDDFDLRDLQGKTSVSVTSRS